MVLKAFEVEKMMTEFAEVIGQEHRRLTQARQAIADVESTPDGATTYSSFIEALDAAAAADPKDIVWALLKARKDKLVGESAAVKAYAANLETAATEVAKP